MPRVIIIDWSTIAYPAWEKMYRKEYINDTTSEIVEFTRNIAEEAYYLVQRFKINEEDQVFFMVDHQNWRVPYYRNYYRKFLKMYRVQNTTSGETGYYFTHDTFEYLIMDAQIDIVSKISEIKLTKKNRNVLSQFRRRPVEHPYQSPIKHLLPSYKGNRHNRKWTHDSTKEEFKKYRTLSAFNLGRTLGAKVVHTEGMEADDLVWAATVENLGKEVIIVSSDTDLDQVRLSHLDVRRWTPEPQKRCWDDRSLSEVQFEVFKKVLQGDNGDNIKPSQDTDGKNFTKKKVEKLFETLTYPETPSVLRNQRLVMFELMPEKIQKAARQAIQDATVPEGPAILLEKYGLEKSKQLRVQRRAEKHRREDV